MRGTVFIGLLTILGALLACRAKLSGNITLDGRKFDVSSCRSGQANVPKFSGVDFLDDVGERIRFIAQDDGRVNALLFPPGAKKGTMIGGSCGTISVNQQNSEVNDVKNVQGSVNADCNANGHHITASIAFKNCH